MEPVIDHIEVTVRDLDAAVAFYDRLHRELVAIGATSVIPPRESPEFPEFTPAASVPGRHVRPARFACSP